MDSPPSPAIGASRIAWVVESLPFMVVLGFMILLLSRVDAETCHEALHHYPPHHVMSAWLTSGAYLWAVVAGLRVRTIRTTMRGPSDFVAIVVLASASALAIEARRRFSHSYVEMGAWDHPALSAACLDSARASLGWGVAGALLAHVLLAREVSQLISDAPSTWRKHIASGVVLVAVLFSHPEWVPFVDVPGMSRDGVGRIAPASVAVAAGLLVARTHRRSIGRVLSATAWLAVIAALAACHEFREGGLLREHPPDAVALRISRAADVAMLASVTFGCAAIGMRWFDAPRSERTRGVVMVVLSIVPYMASVHYAPSLLHVRPADFEPFPQIGRVHPELRGNNGPFDFEISHAIWIDRHGRIIDPADTPDVARHNFHFLTDACSFFVHAAPTDPVVPYFEHRPVHYPCSSTRSIHLMWAGTFDAVQPGLRERRGPTRVVGAYEYRWQSSAESRSDCNHADATDHRMPIVQRATPAVGDDAENCLEVSIDRTTRAETLIRLAHAQGERPMTFYVRVAPPVSGTLSPPGESDAGGRQAEQR